MQTSSGVGIHEYRVAFYEQSKTYFNPRTSTRLHPYAQLDLRTVPCTRYMSAKESF